MKKKKIIQLALFNTIVSLAALGSITFAWFDGRDEINISFDGSSKVQYFDSGSGTQEDPYRITRPMHLYNLSCLQNLGVFEGSNYYFEIGKLDDAGNYRVYGDDVSTFLTQDTIDMSTLQVTTDKAILPIGNATYNFTSTLFGNNLNISNLHVKDNDGTTTVTDIGMFGYVGAGSTITRFNLVEPQIITTTTSSTKRVGFIAGYVDGTETVMTHVNYIGVYKGRMSLQGPVRSEYAYFGGYSDWIKNNSTSMGDGDGEGGRTAFYSPTDTNGTLEIKKETYVIPNDTSSGHIVIAGQIKVDSLSLANNNDILDYNSFDFEDASVSQEAKTGRREFLDRFIAKAGENNFNITENQSTHTFSTDLSSPVNVLFISAKKRNSTTFLYVSEAGIIIPDRCIFFHPLVDGYVRILYAPYPNTTSASIYKLASLGQGTRNTANAKQQSGLVFDYDGSAPNEMINETTVGKLALYELETKAGEAYAIASEAAGKSEAFQYLYFEIDGVSDSGSVGGQERSIEAVDFTYDPKKYLNETDYALSLTYFVFDGSNIGELYFDRETEVRLVYYASSSSLVSPSNTNVAVYGGAYGG